MAFNHFSNGDGLLGIWQRDKLVAQRLFLTDSGHYLLAINGFGRPEHKEYTSLITDTSQSMQTASEQLNAEGNFETSNWQNESSRSGQEHMRFSQLQIRALSSFHSNTQCGNQFPLKQTHPVTLRRVRMLAR